MKSIGIASDHAGFEYKGQLTAFLEGHGYSFENYGTNSSDSCDYPDFAHPVAAEVESGKHDLGIVICGSGNGVCMTVNKYPGVRGAMAWNEELATLARTHNDANILCLAARFISIEEAKKISLAFLTGAFEGGRHARRVGKIAR